LWFRLQSQKDVTTNWPLLQEKCLILKDFNKWQSAFTASTGRKVGWKT
jgi:hypothetical protein